MAEEEVVVPSVVEPVKETAVSPPGQPPPAEPDDDDAAVEADAVEVKGAKYVRLEAVKEARAKTKEAKAEAKAARAEADRAKTVDSQLQEAMPYIQALRDRPDLLEKLRQPPAAEAKPEPKDDPELVDFARSVGLYNAQAQPDVEAAKRVVAFLDKRAKAAAADEVRPLQEQTAQERSAVNYQRALNIKDPTTGRAPSPETLGFMWKNMPASYSSDPRVAAIMAYAALGYDISHATPQPKPPDRPPLETEGSGSRTTARGLSDFEQKIAADRGKTDAQWRELTKGHQPGRPFVLED